MESVVGLFESAERARRAAEAISRAGIPTERLSVLTPGSSEGEIHAKVPTSETEQPGMGKAVGGVVGGVFGATTGMGLGALAATGVTVVDARVVDDGDLVTAAGVTSGLDLGLYLLEREVGPRVAHAVERYFAYERRGTVWRAYGPVPVAA